MRLIIFMSLVLTLTTVGPLVAQTGTLAKPFPPPATNAALYYQRALLLLAELDDEVKRPLDRPIWEVLPEQPDGKLPANVARLLRQGRHATDAAMGGAVLVDCDFGVDFRRHGAATLLPHVGPMTQLGRLVTLRGAYIEAKGDWEQAAVIYFEGLHIGRHMTHQQTLLEAVAGLKILENNYFALSRWAITCPNRQLVVRALGTLETLSQGTVDPARTLVSEAAILRTDFEILAAQYPDGDWAETILEGYGSPLPKGDQKAVRAAAKAECLKRGVPEKAFQSPAAFRAYLSHLSVTTAQFAEVAAISMTWPPLARIERSQELFEKHAELVKVLGDDTFLNPAEIGALFAEHEAELTVTRVVLALAAGKSERSFPEDLGMVAHWFGGTVPTNPYDGSPLVYQTDRQRANLSVQVPAVKTKSLTLPEVHFESKPPVSAPQ